MHACAFSYTCIQMRLARTHAQYSARDASLFVAWLLLGWNLARLYLKTEMHN
jgi:hypothetical protein